MCFRCEVLQLIENLSKDKIRKTGFYPKSRICRRDFCLKNYDKIKKYSEQNRKKKFLEKKEKRDSC